MKLTFFGAAKAVTGSCHCVEANGRKLLVDCGLTEEGLRVARLLARDRRWVAVCAREEIGGYLQ